MSAREPATKPEPVRRRVVKVFQRQRPAGLRTEWNVTFSCGHMEFFVGSESSPINRVRRCQHCTDVRGKRCCACGKKATQLCYDYGMFGLVCGFPTCDGPCRNHPHRHTR